MASTEVNSTGSYLADIPSPKTQYASEKERNDAMQQFLSSQH